LGIQEHQATQWLTLSRSYAEIADCDAADRVSEIQERHPLAAIESGGRFAQDSVCLPLLVGPARSARISAAAMPIPCGASR